MKYSNFNIFRKKNYLDFQTSLNIFVKLIFVKIFIWTMDKNVIRNAAWDRHSVSMLYVCFIEHKAVKTNDFGQN